VIDEVAMQLAMRSRALTLSVAATGLVSLSATATGYARTTGSFQADGFWPGMEVTVAGFANNGPAVITAVSALTIDASRVIATTVNGVAMYSLAAPPVEGPAGGRSLTAGLPSQRAWENVAFQPTAGVPWVEEHFISGPFWQQASGPLGECVVEPQYALHVNLPAETGLTVRRYVNALRVLFAPRTAIPLANGDVLRVRWDTGPYPGALQQGQPGFVVLPITFPLRLRTSNLI
jgi:hypothetical protein